MDQFFAVTPCRVIDTASRLAPWAVLPSSPERDRNFTIVGNCGIPESAKAVSVNVAVTAPTAAGNLRLYPAGTTLPLVFTLNYSAGETRSNNAIVPLSAGGSITVRCAQASGTADMILDVNGYFE